MVKDQRHMSGITELSSVQQVEAFWREYMLRRGKVLTQDDRPVYAYVSDSRWVADCLSCRGGIAVWSENPVGCCLDCGHVYPVVFPKDAEEAVQILLRRPEENRNWMPHNGETVENLKAENIVMGVM